VTREVGEDVESLIVYSTETCGMCFALKSWLRSWNVPYDEVDISRDGEARSFVRRVARGYLSVPTVRLPDGRILVEPRRADLAAALGLPA